MVTKKTAAVGLAATIEDLNKRFGSGTVMRMGESPRYDIEVISTGILPLDLALGAGGFPRGRIIEIAGPFASGKSSIALTYAAEVQKLGLQVLYIDLENALDPVYSRAIGVDIDSMLITQPGSANDALEIMDDLIKTGEFGAVVVDSVAAMPTKQELEGAYGDANIAALARLMSQALRKMTGTIANTKTTVLFINQLRDNIGGYGPTEVTSGGKALGYYSSCRIDVRRKETMKQTDGVPWANRTKITVKKNRVGAPFREAEVDLVYGRGIPRENCIVDLGLTFGLVERAGAWYSYDDEQIGQGRTKAIQHLVQHPDKCDELEKKIREAAAEAPTVEETIEDDDEEE